MLVLQVGPSPDAMGGIASVVNQIDGLDVGPGFSLGRFVTTSSPRKHESLVARVARHLGSLLRLVQAIRTSRCAILHIHTCSGFSFYRSLLDALVARVMWRRTVLHIHGASFNEFFKRTSWLGKRLIRAGLRSVDRVVALSESWRATISRMSPKARICVIENAVGLPDLPGDAAPAEPAGDQGTPCRFLLLARMDKWKGIDDLLDACVRLYERSVPFKLTLAGPAGSAGDANSLTRRIQHLGLADRVRYVGEVRGVDKNQLLCDSDAYVQSSHHEGMPIAVLEALAYGLPVVATDVGSLREVITPGREGLIVPAHDPNALARAMARIAANVEERCNMALAARGLARRRFSESRLREDLVRLYRGLVTGAGHATAEVETEAVIIRESSRRRVLSASCPESVAPTGMEIIEAGEEASTAT